MHISGPDSPLSSRYATAHPPPSCKVTSAFNSPAQNLLFALQACTSCSLPCLREWQLHPSSCSGPKSGSQPRLLSLTTDPTSKSHWIYFQRTSRIQSLLPTHHLPAVPQSTPPSPCLDGSKSLSLLPLLPLRNSSQQSSTGISLKLGEISDFSAQNPALTLKLKRIILTHVELPAPPNHPTKTWPPTASLPSCPASSFPLTLLQPHWPLLFHSHLHACCSSARNIPPCPLRLLHFSPQHYGHLVHLLSISPSPSPNRASGKQRLSLFPFLAVLSESSYLSLRTPPRAAAASLF